MSYTITVSGTAITASSNTNALQVYNVVVDVVRIDKISGSTGVVEMELVIAANVPAKIRWSRGSEKILFDKDTWLRDGTLRCRMIAGITTNDRIRFVDQSGTSRDFEIIDVIDYRNLGTLMVLTIRKVG